MFERKSGFFRHSCEALFNSQRLVQQEAPFNRRMSGHPAPSAFSESLKALDPAFAHCLSGINSCLGFRGVAAQGYANLNLAPRREMPAWPHRHSGEGRNRTSTMRQSIVPAKALVRRSGRGAAFRGSSAIPASAGMTTGKVVETLDRGPPKLFGQQCAFAGMTSSAKCQSRPTSPPRAKGAAQLQCPSHNPLTATALSRVL